MWYLPAERGLSSGGQVRSLSGQRLVRLLTAYLVACSLNSGLPVVVQTHCVAASPAPSIPPRGPWGQGNECSG